MKYFILILTLRLLELEYSSAVCSGFTPMTNFDPSQMTGKYWYTVASKPAPEGCSTRYFTLTADGKLDSSEERLSFTTSGTAAGDLSLLGNAAGQFDILATDYTSFYLIKYCNLLTDLTLYATSPTNYNGALASAQSYIPAGTTLTQLATPCAEVTTTTTTTSTTPKSNIFKKIFAKLG